MFSPTFLTSSARTFCRRYATLRRELKSAKWRWPADEAAGRHEFVAALVEQAERERAWTRNEDQGRRARGGGGRLLGWSPRNSRLRHAGRKHGRTVTKRARGD